jgi:hypothetical protein
MDSCASGECLPLLEEPLEPVNFCAVPCCTSFDCPTEVHEGLAYRLACAPTDSGLAACSSLVRHGSDGAVGTLCLDGFDCRSGVCIQTATGERYCTDTCCRDHDCGDTTRYACRPTTHGDKWALRCVVK